jgi:hypothetical protein
MEISKKFVLGAVLLGIAAYLALGIAGDGGDDVATLLTWSGIDIANAGRASKGLLGLVVASSAFFMTTGYYEDRDGKIIEKIVVADPSANTAIKKT